MFFAGIDMLFWNNLFRLSILRGPIETQLLFYGVDIMHFNLCFRSFKPRSCGCNRNENN